MDRKTATAISYLLILRRLAKMHGITDPEDIIVLAAMVAVSAQSSSVSFGTAATALGKAPPHIVESMKYVLDEVRDQTDKIMADPDFMKVIEDKAAELGV